MTVFRPIKCVSLTECKYHKSLSAGNLSGPLVQVADGESHVALCLHYIIYLESGNGEAPLDA